jgi:hypothetical protein
MAAEQHGGPHVRDAPGQREDANRDEHGGGQARRECNRLSFRIGRKGERPGREQEH